VHAFIDESQRRATYLLACAQVPDADMANVRRTLRACRLPGQRRLHFVDERDQRRRQLLAVFAQLPIEFVVVAVPLGSRREAEARRLALQAIIGKIADDTDRLIIESRQGRDLEDRRAIATSLKHTRTTLHYAHRQPHDEPGLWLPDGVAWAVGAGGRWLKHLDGATVCIERIDP